MTFPDGLTSETQGSDVRAVDCRPQLAQRTDIGAAVPVRYDERDHSHIVLDLLALVEEILGSPEA